MSSIMRRRSGVIWLLIENSCLMDCTNAQS
jgi:hypothetical protein